MTENTNKHGADSLFLKLIKPNAICPVCFIHAKFHEAYEYRCKDCKQLRLSFVESDVCANCGSANITKGDIGTL